MVYIFVALLAVLLILMALMYRYNRLHQAGTSTEPADHKKPALANKGDYSNVPTVGGSWDEMTPSVVGGSIMIVDDQAMIRVLLMEVFAAIGLEVYEAGDGAEAIHQFEQKPVDLVLMDLKMPEMNGIEALLRLRRIKPDLIAVMISAYGEPVDIENAERLGVTQFFNKPFDIDELKKHVLNQLKIARSLNAVRLR
ncbi:response regulator [Paenibacillus daejeonensis]|uniref:response regulator n=1 Tax=Paenibacillus daejeonensis TaxID=135193 RepID=UPI00035F61CF|nr:response regulator [Paenibacillus daejeonensis]